MRDDPDDVVDALAHAEDAFGSHTMGLPEYEDGLDPNVHDTDVIQLRKACRLLGACRLLRSHDGYHTSVIEMSFAAIERTLEFYSLTASNDSIDQFLDHDRAYDRAADLGVFSPETARRLKQLYDENRTAAYYRETVATTRQADVTFELAATIHEAVTNFAQQSHECRCNE